MIPPGRTILRIYRVLRSDKGWFVIDALRKTYEISMYPISPYCPMTIDEWLTYYERRIP